MCLCLCCLWVVYFFFFLVIFFSWGENGRRVDTYVQVIYIFTLYVGIVIYTLLLSYSLLFDYSHILATVSSSLSLSFVLSAGHTCTRTYIQAHMYMCAFYLRFGYYRLRPLYVDRRACLGPRVFAKPRISPARITCVSVCLFIRSFIYSSFLPPQRVPSNASLSRFLILMIRARHRGCRALPIQCLILTLLCLSLSRGSRSGSVSFLESQFAVREGPFQNEASTR